MADTQELKLNEEEQIEVTVEFKFLSISHLC